MDFKKKWSHFWTFQRQSNGGFTLVELIVVIAILAILAAVAVPAYSGYVTRTNKAADETLISQVENAIALAYYSNPDKVETGTIVLYLDKAPEASNDFLETALVDAFGDYSGAMLKFDGWTSNYTASSFAGQEKELLKDVDFLTGEMAPVIAGLSGDNFNQWLSANNITSTDSNVLADAAVLYVADNTKKQDKDALVNAMISGNLGEIQMVFGNSSGASIATAAATYAMIEGFCYYADNIKGGTAYRDLLNEEIDTRADGITDTMGAATEVFNSLSVILAQDGAVDLFTEYQKGQATKDAAAYIDMMSTVSDSKGVVTGNLGAADCFTGEAVNNLFVSYAEGAVIISAIEQTDGTVLVKNSIEED